MQVGAAVLCQILRLKTLLQKHDTKYQHPYVRSSPHPNPPPPPPFFPPPPTPNSLQTDPLPLSNAGMLSEIFAHPYDTIK